MSEKKQGQKKKRKKDVQTPQQSNGAGPEKRQNNPRRAKTLIMWVLLIMLSMVFVQFFSRNRSDEMLINYTSFRLHLANDNVREVIISDKIIVGKFVNGVTVRSGPGQEAPENTFKVNIPFEDPDLIHELEQRNVEINPCHTFLFKCVRTHLHHHMRVTGITRPCK